MLCSRNDAVHSLKKKEEKTRERTPPCHADFPSTNRLYSYFGNRAENNYVGLLGGRSGGGDGESAETKCEGWAPFFSVLCHYQ